MQIPKSGSIVPRKTLGLTLHPFRFRPVVPLLLLMAHCGEDAKGFASIPGTVEMLHPWNNEGAPPEDKVMTPLLPVDRRESVAVGHAVGGGLSTLKGSSSTSVTKGQQEVLEVDGRIKEHKSFHSGVATRYSVTVGMAASADRASRVAGTASEVTGARAAVAALNEDYLRRYFFEKTASFTDEDGLHTARDCLLLYSQEDVASLDGSVGCCSFIEGELDDMSLDDLGFKFKKLAEVCLGRKIEMEMEPTPVPQAGLRRASVYEQSQVLSEGSHAPGAASPPASSLREVSTETVRQEIVTERASGQSLKVTATSLPEPAAPRNVLVTETSYTTDSALPPGAGVLRPSPPQGVVVTERVYAPAATWVDQHFSHAGNVVVTERVIQPSGGLAGLQEGAAHLSDANYVMVREKESFLAPEASVLHTLATASGPVGPNVAVTERVLTAASSAPSSYQIPVETSVKVRKTSVSRVGPVPQPSSAL